MSIKAMAYIIAEIDVHDAEGFEAYRSGVAPIVTTHGGRYLVRGGAISALEGAAPDKRVVVLEFPSRAAAETFWQSAEYRPVAALRHRSAHSRIFMIEGTQP